MSTRALKCHMAQSGGVSFWFCHWLQAIKKHRSAVSTEQRESTYPASGKDAKRSQLEAMQSFVRDGDTVFCYSMDRLTRNLDNLRRIVLGLTERGVHIVFVKENLTFTGEDSPMSHLLLSVIG